MSARIVTLRPERQAEVRAAHSQCVYEQQLVQMRAKAAERAAWREGLERGMRRAGPAVFILGAMFGAALAFTVLAQTR